MVRLTVMLCVMDPDVPLSVSEYVPTGAWLPALMVTVACAEFVPFNVTWPCETLQFVLAGWPLQESETFPLNPAIGVSVSEVVPDCEREIVSDAGDAEIEKSLTFCVRSAEELSWKFAFVETKVALTVWLPPLSEFVENVAVPLEIAED
jgi:hypothetical protein